MDNNKINKKRAGGFTLIELVMVIAILAILAAIGVPVFVDLSDDAKSATAKGAVNSIRSALNIKIAEDAAGGGSGACPGVLSGTIFANGLVPKNPINGLRTVQATVSTCTGANPDLDGSHGFLYKASTCTVCMDTTGTDPVTGDAWVTF